MPIALDDKVDASSSSYAHVDPKSFPALDHFQIKNIPPAAYYIPDFITAQEEEYLLRKLEESPQPKWKKVGSGRRLQYWGGTMSSGGTLLPEPLPEWLTSFPDIIQRIDSFLDVASGHEYTGHGRVLGINQVLVNEYQPLQGISPHEDGPAFRPLVATLSLGSHTVLDIHQYLSTTTPSPPMVATLASSTDTSAGRPIAAIPLAHLLLLPRSLLILSSSLYTSHLHGIAARMSDSVLSRPLPSASLQPDSMDDPPVIISNADLLGDPDIMDRLRADTSSWKAERGVRTSLTFRHANKVLKGGAFAMAQGALRRT
ncbi:hypothetical protein BD324DRAFT_156655 [Kockovaella imperatae]|uniref:Fe2OG dioxygenase domain-containing protein n=1 Tax=Kockovaella imperatae TaxID=4999 RepID=A0A1Y1UBR5_9TREE|nr:hypothetical protein BD324DRAFT_156655 [Kockovaella imperatae]ORX34525.1 hypothetical protein BD324DRAFT_156655 [Kockovaella imperatae]